MDEDNSKENKTTVQVLVTDLLTAMFYMSSLAPYLKSREEMLLLACNGAPYPVRDSLRVSFSFVFVTDAYILINYT